jgi:DNA-binding SARP family transcriptional activator/tetratricopeptide (TPR) repeat protein
MSRLGTYDGLREGETAVEFRILGPVQLWANEGKQIDLGSRKERCVLAALLWERGHPLPASALIDKVWEDDLPDRVHASLYGYISRLRGHIRQASGSTRDLLPSNASGFYALTADSSEVDFRRFLDLADRGRAAMAEGDTQQAVALFRDGERLWRGTPLADLSGRWVELIRMRLERERLTLSIDRLDAELRIGRHAAAVGELIDLAAQHPLDEKLTGLVMLALNGSGRTSEALGVFRRFERHLRDEDGSDPTPELADLHLRMLKDAQALVTRPSGRPSMPLAVPLPRTPVEASASALPRDNPDFTGRVPELEMLAGGMSSEQGRTGVPVIVISGMPGVGKTMLAVHAAHLLGGQYAHKVHLGLHAHDPAGQPLEPAVALATALRTIGIKDNEIPDSADDRATMWRSRAREALVVLDDAKDEEQILPLLPGAPGSAVLVTSRHRLLNVPGMLALPLGTLPPVDAAELFTRVAGPDRVTDPAEVASVLGLCGHLPIEIHLAATQLRRHSAWTMGDLIARLREINAEDRGIAASLELSYRYLMPEQQQLMRRLALHPDSSFSRYAGAALAGGVPLRATERALEALVDYHLIEESARDRFAFHDLIRDYAKHVAATHDSAQDRHQSMQHLLDYYVCLADRADQVAFPFHRRLPVHADTVVPDVRSKSPALPPLHTRQDSKKWMEAERTSLQRAARHAAAHGFPEHAALLPHLLAKFLDASGDWTEGIDLHRLSAEAWHTIGNPSGEARALTDLGLLLSRMGRNDEAISRVQAALTVARAASSRADEADALSAMGVIRWLRAEYSLALACHDEALTIWRSLSDRHGEADTLHRSALVSWHMRRPDVALRQAEQALVVYRELGDRQGETNSLNNLGDMQQAAGSHEQALANYEQALTMFQEMGDRQGEAIAMSNIGDICRGTGQLEKAVRCYRTALDEFRAIGDRRSQAEVLISMGTAFCQQRDTTAAIDNFQKALVIAHRLAEKYHQALAYLGLGHAHLDSMNYGTAADDFRAAIELSRQIHDPDSEARARDGLRVALQYLNDPASPSPLGRQPVALSHLTGAPSPARRNGSSSWSQAVPSSFSSSLSRTDVPVALIAMTARSLPSGTRMSPLALVTAEKMPRFGV